MQAARRLARRSFRERERRFLLEGPRALAEAIDAGARIHDVYVTEGDTILIDAARAAGASVHEVSEHVLRAISDAATPQGIAAIAQIPDADMSAIDLSSGLVLVVAEIRDPGNAGTLVRTAAAAGCGGIVFTSGSVDPFGPRTVRAAAGALFRTPIVTRVALSDVADYLKDAGFVLIGTDARATRSVYDIDLTRPGAIVVGNEAWGVPTGDADLLDEVASIPMPGGVESLNVAVAGSLFLFETLRQRQLGSAGV